MRYVSTRNSKQDFSFREIFLNGLAQDGGLYVPEKIPSFSSKDLKDLKKLSYEELAVKIILELRLIHTLCRIPVVLLERRWSRDCPRRRRPCRRWGTAGRRRGRRSRRPAEGSRRSRRTRSRTRRHSRTSCLLRPFGRLF